MNKTILTGLCAFLVAAGAARAQGTAFTYQGRLSQNGAPANGTYDFAYNLYNAETNGLNVGNGGTSTGVQVSNGLFTVTYDPNIAYGGPPIFDGAPRWLQIVVRTNGAGAYTLLAPRQKLTPAPYAITASNLSGTLPASQLSGALPSPQLSGTYSGAVTLNNAANQLMGAHNGNGAGLTNLNAGNLAGGTVADARLSANVALLNGSQTFTGAKTFSNILTAPSGVRVNETNIWFRGDQNHGVGWYGAGRPFATNNTIDGPVLFGYSGGALGTEQYGVERLALHWTAAGHVGIGTNNPASHLHVADTAQTVGIFDGSHNGGTWVNLRNTSTNGREWNLISSGSGNGEGPGKFLFRDPAQGVVMTLSTNGNVGVGTDAPQRKLDVNGAARATSFEGGGAGLTGLNAANITGGVLPEGQLPVNIARLNAAQTFTSDNRFSGRVGIGTTPSSFSLDAFSESADVARLGSSSPLGTWLSLQNDTGRRWNLISSGSSSPEGPGKLLVKLTSPLVADLSSKLTLTTNGDLGIGVGSPVSRLDVGGAATVRGNIIVDGNGTNAGSLSPGLIFGGGSGEGIASQRTGGGPTEFGLNFYTDFSRRLTIDNTGHVGIGTDTPQNALLDVEGDVRLNDHILHLRAAADTLHGLTYRSSFASQTVDGPALYGWAGGVLGTTQDNTERWSLRWNKDEVRVKVLTIEGGADVAEPFPMQEEDIEPGSVVVIDDEHPGRLKKSAQSYDTRVAGIVSGAGGVKPGIALHQQGVMEGDKNVALTGRVYVKADASHGAIRPGDLLTTSALPGHAMKVGEHGRAQGAILGKAMSALSEGTGLVLVLVSLQ